MNLRVLRSTLGALLFLGAATQEVAAQQVPLGFQINRYEPSAAGEWSFWVDHPWFSSTRRFAGGVTLNYAHNPLVFGVKNTAGVFERTEVVVANQLMLHADLAVSFLDRVTLTGSLPFVLVASGDGSMTTGLQGSGAGVGDPRFGAMLRVVGQPDESPISLSIGVQAWVPLADGSLGRTSTGNDAAFRFLPKIILAGYGSHLRWSATAGFLYRPEARLANGLDFGSTAGSELQLGASLYYADKDRNFAVGPEAVLGTLVLPNRAFEREGTSLEVLLAAHYNIAHTVQVGLAGGLGILRQPGTPDGRVLLRLAYAPLVPPVYDRDNDGVSDKEDQCPDAPKGENPDRERVGCPLTDRDKDGVFDNEDECPDVMAGDHPNPKQKGCPAKDTDSDGFWDHEDQCIETAAGKQADPEKKGCPLRDQDGDGVFDRDDQCPSTAAGAHPDPAKRGCPASDTDGDGVYDPEDRCVNLAQGPKPDSAKPGCPLPDRDNDSVVDIEDACPDKVGAPSTDPKKNGCPGLVEVRNGSIVILQQIFFATNKDVILPKSAGVLKAVGEVLRVAPHVKRIAIEGHTDNQGKPDKNLDLSNRRALSVQRYLATKEGIDGKRLEAHGYGDTRPIADNKAAKGRTMNRRVDFVIVDPAQPKGSQQQPIVVPAQSTVTQKPAPAPGKPATKRRAKGTRHK